MFCQVNQDQPFISFYKNIENYGNFNCFLTILTKSKLFFGYLLEYLISGLKGFKRNGRRCLKVCGRNRICGLICNLPNILAVQMCPAPSAPQYSPKHPNKTVITILEYTRKNYYFFSFLFLLNLTVMKLFLLPEISHLLVIPENRKNYLYKNSANEAFAIK